MGQLNQHLKNLYLLGRGKLVLFDILFYSKTKVLPASRCLPHIVSIVIVESSLVLALPNSKIGGHFGAD